MAEDTLFDPHDYLPPGPARRLLQPKRPTGPAWNAVFGGPTRVIRVPVTWDRDELVARIETLHSALGTAEAAIAEAKERGHGQLSNRFEKLAELVAELRDAWPEGDQYDPFVD